MSDCTKVGPGCDHCYAEADFDHRKHRVKWGAGQARSRTSAANWKKPIKWNNAPFFECDCGRRGDQAEFSPDLLCQTCGGTPNIVSRRVFCASLADVFDNEVDPAWRADLFQLIADTPNLDWLLLTKRIGNVASMAKAATEHMREGVFEWPWPNVWIGATVVNQEEADRDIPKLLAAPARVRFLSIEPMLGPIDLTRDGLVCAPCQLCIDQAPDPETNAVECRACCCTGKGDEWALDWVICGGESGHAARPMHPAWALSLRDQCAAAGVPFLFKQWGEYAPTQRTMAEVSASDEKLTPVPHSATQFYPVAAVDRVGKKAAGRLLDGREWNGFPP